MNKQLYVFFLLFQQTFYSSFGRTSNWPSNNYIYHRIPSKIPSEGNYIVFNDPLRFFSWIFFTENNIPNKNLSYIYRARKNVKTQTDGKVNFYNWNRRSNRLLTLLEFQNKRVKGGKIHLCLFAVVSLQKSDTHPWLMSNIYPFTLVFLIALL